MRAEEYDLALDVNHRLETFRGVLHATFSDLPHELELDAAGLTIDRVEVGGAERPFRLDEPRQKLHVTLPAPGAHKVAIHYSGRARRDVLNGFYVSRFGDSHLLTTMMEPVGCRWLLPCLDRPDQKAVFRLRVMTDPDLTVVSNAALESVEPHDERRTWTFAPTPRMSTYLLYLGVGKFDALEAVDDGIRIVAVTAPGKAALARRAVSVVGPLLRGYSEYYGVPYPLEKLHLVAVPDLWAGGMENWGAIVIPELGLLLDETTSPSVVRWAMETLAHEVAHQWFGNLVTMQTFDDLWLNESFATFVAAKMQERLRLRSDPWAEFLIRTSPGYFSDSYRSTHPIQMTLNDPSEISQSTDDITYYKGANIVRMIETYLGEAAFRTGVSGYLRQFAYQNARGEDLWRALEVSSHEPVQAVMRAWVDRAGHPVVRVVRHGSRLDLTQERFTFHGTLPDDPPWPIPLRILDGATLRRVLFDGRSISVELGTPETYLVNPGRTTFARVWYDAEERRRKIEELPNLPAFDRWAFLNDAFALTLAGEYGIPDYLAAVRAVTPVTDYPSVDDTARSLGFLLRVLPDDAEVATTARAFLKSQLGRLGRAHRPGEPELDAVLREQVSLRLVRVDDEFARSLVKGFGTSDGVDAALRGASAVAFARLGGARAIDRLFEIVRTAPRPDESEQAAFAMEGLPSPELVTEALDRSLGPGIRTSVVQYVIASAVSSPHGRGVAWPWLKEHLREFERRAEGSWMLSKLLEHVIPLVGLDRPTEVREYFRTASFPEGSSGQRKGLELLDVVDGLRARRTPVGRRGQPVPP